MEKKILKICEKSAGYKYEGPRYKRLGPFSGEEFRNIHLLPWLESLADQEESIVDFTGTEVYSPSFLEESFGGAIRNAKNRQEAEKNRQKLKSICFVNIDPIWKEKLLGYIENAKYRLEKTE
jgi:hypothetical protein